VNDNAFEPGEHKTTANAEMNALISKLEALEENIESQSNEWQITILEIRTALQKLSS
jgi:hypothetical protein